MSLNVLTTSLSDLLNTSAAVSVISDAGNAIEDHQWSILHSGPSDLILAGPGGRVPIPDIVEALVGLCTEATNRK
jgi:hypothetical protein